MFELNTKILIVDDMITMRKIVSKYLKELGYTDITEAVDGNDAWDKATSTELPFGLIISDWNMPGSTGIELLKKLRANALTASVPFIMVTAEGEQHQVQEATNFGVDAYVLKPFAKDKLTSVLSEVSGKRKAA